MSIPGAEPAAKGGQTSTVEVPVLIVGAGPAGLALSVALSRYLAATLRDLGVGPGDGWIAALQNDPLFARWFAHAYAGVDPEVTLTVKLLVRKHGIVNACSCGYIVACRDASARRTNFLVDDSSQFL